MAKTVSAKQAAMTRARQRRIAFDVNRDQRDRRIECAAADVFLHLDKRAAAQFDLEMAEAAIGAAIRRLLDESVPLPDVAELIEVDLRTVRRLSRLRPRADDVPPAVGSCEIGPQQLR